MTQQEALKPSAALLVKIGSALIHYAEYSEPGGHPIDLQTAQQLMQDSELQEWSKAMGVMLPRKRSEDGKPPARSGTDSNVEGGAGRERQARSAGNG